MISWTIINFVLGYITGMFLMSFGIAVIEYLLGRK
jgi:hypothetical protein